MTRFLVGLSALALLMPALASAQDDKKPEEKKPEERPRAEAPHAARPEAARPAPAAHRAPEKPAARPEDKHAPQGGDHFVYKGQPHARFHGPEFHYPAGYGYRRWGVGERLPPLFLVRDYFFTDYAALGLAPPPYGYQWVRYGPDLLLVQIGTGQVTDVVYGAVY